ncbi:hypothetical protein SeMB42_g01549 [Synchytrium endobioticum]|uniref:Small-subunit processome Utp12 domain-containing protein n=1 Tax=Synchytrium endobioticum TaxID=286115 RepID=A0A507DM05_9FUNG|nr:hypothetical protein SeLEV6574_g07537 [Synchytrium endobioticum]TPX52227.1 hypothetical protein SeMB42_g01549 [Synchytrium endobioticum]
MRAYDRYRAAGVYGIITSNANAAFDAEGKLAICPALEDVILWNVRQGQPIARWHDEDNHSEATSICKSPNNTTFAVGYADGAIRLWDIRTNSSSITFTGHTAAVTALAFSQDAARLASGSRDTDLIIWDIVAESGLYRLRGHKDQITSIVFLLRNGLNHVITASKDTLLKVWDLTAKHCVETVIAHRGEIWCLTTSPDERILFTGGVDDEIRVWDIDTEALSTKLVPVDSSADVMDVGNPLKKALNVRGSIQRQSKERVVTIQFHPSERYLGIQGNDKMIEVYKIKTEDEIRRKQARRAKRQREKQQKSKLTEPPSVVDESDDNETTATSAISISDIYTSFVTIRASARIRSFDFSPKTTRPDAPFQVLVSLTNNAVEIYTANSPDKTSPTQLVTSIDLAGHRSDVRCVALSSDDQLIASASNDCIKIWSAQTGQCLKSMESGYALCASFLPGNKHLIIGTKTGDLELYDLGSSSLLETAKAHTASVWSLQVRYDKGGLVTGSADKEVKFWDFSLREDASDSSSSRRLKLTHTRTLRMSDDVLSVRYSPDGRYLLVALLDSTVKVFYTDTLKFYLSLYGHKLPVLSIDVSSDSKLVATASADKTIKLWGLDFGDCHRSLLAHQDSVMSVRFAWGTHSLFSVGKDRVVKYWDGDKFEQIMKLEGHHAEVWALAVGQWGSIVVTGSHDRSIRLWEKTDSPLYLEDEREQELEQMYDRAAVMTTDGRNDAPIGSGVEDLDGLEAVAIPNENAGKGEVGLASRQTSTSLKSGEKVVEALEIWEEESVALVAYEQAKLTNPNVAKPAQSPYITVLNDPAMTHDRYVLRTVQMIRPADLEEALLTLPFTQVLQLLRCMVAWTQKRWNPPLCARILFFVLKTHHNQLTTTASIRSTLVIIKNNLNATLREQRDTIGFNLAGLRYLKREDDANRIVSGGIDAVDGSLDVVGANSNNSGGVGSKKGKKRSRS